MPTSIAERTDRQRQAAASSGKQRQTLKALTSGRQRQTPKALTSTLDVRVLPLG
ncbi:hypothetical protein [Saccharomonospora marina]|uniref:hypothetical protein n=1 Tax=Saccharomonospora marina TaxID=632569 RepID=UPI0012F96177|nr:hypothetical protein [Saccharomonospora marina]